MLYTSSAATVKAVLASLRASATNTDDADHMISKLPKVLQQFVIIEFRIKLETRESSQWDYNMSVCYFTRYRIYQLAVVTNLV